MKSHRKELWFKTRTRRAFINITQQVEEALAESGVKRMAIVAPGFSADCLETLEELDGENREIFLHNGGERFAYLPCLNDSEDGMRVIRHVVERELQGWL